MKFEDHCRISIELFGEDGAEFHMWIDKHFKLYGYSHRCILHNKEGIEEGVKMFGEQARKHLERHIKDDFDTDTIPSKEEQSNWII